MKLKKFFLSFFVTLASVFMVLGLSSCSTWLHQHTFSDWQTEVAATCTSFGLEKRTCSCGHIEYDTIAALSHTPVVDEGVAATCTTAGKTEGSHCADCGTVIVAQTEVERLAHSFSDWQTVVEATCTSFGLYMRACDCGQTEYNTAESFSHTPVVDEAVTATCTELGKTEGSHCAECGTILVAQSAVAPLGHDCSDVRVVEEAFCNAEGKKKFSCVHTGCGYYYEESYALEPIAKSEIYNAAAQYTGKLLVCGRLGYVIDEVAAFVISADGKIVTSNAGLDNGYSAWFVLGGVYYDVTHVLAYKEGSSFAVLQIDATDLPYANLCARVPAVADTIYTVGVLGASSTCISSGIVSHPIYVSQEGSFIQHNAEASRSYLGGPLLNVFGEVIGVNVDYSSSERACLSVSAEALNALDYSNPMTIEEYGKATYTPIEQIRDWVDYNQNESIGNEIMYVLHGDNFYYSIGYNTDNNYGFVTGHFQNEQGYLLDISIIFANTAGNYPYNASFSAEGWTNEVHGFVEAGNYTQSTTLTYDLFYGRYWGEEELMTLYSYAVYDLLGWFSYCLDTYFDTLTLETFGFDALSYDRDAEALDKLNNYVVENGNLDEDNGEYVLMLELPVNEDTVVLKIGYMPASETAPASTMITTYYYTAQGEVYVVMLNLNAVDEGNRFGVLYAVHDGTEFQTLNTGWGYLDANSFTCMSQLTCYEFLGLNDCEDAFLAEYASLLSYTMGILNEFLPSVDPALSMKDFGFLFYFGFEEMNG